MRNYEIEKRIADRRNHDKKYGINSYGGMGMDGDNKHILIEELNYMKAHPEIYKNPVIKNNDTNIYLIKLNNNQTHLRDFQDRDIY